MSVMKSKSPSTTACRKPKTIFSLDVPYTDVRWPEVSDGCQAEILDKLCSLLSPIGEYRSQNITPSQGKRVKKRKRADSRISNDQSAAIFGRLSGTDALARPETHRHLTVGFNTTTRYLEFLAKTPSPNTNQSLGPVTAPKSSGRPSLDPADIKPLTAVFVARSRQPPTLYSHLPLLTKAASLAVPSSPPIRIVLLPEGAEDRLKTALGIPRVGMVGLIDGAPSASSLVELVRQNVPELEVPWLEEAVKGAYLAVKINTVQTDAPLNPKRGSRSSASAIVAVS